MRFSRVVSSSSILVAASLGVSCSASEAASGSGGGGAMAPSSSGGMVGGSGGSKSPAGGTSSAGSAGSTGSSGAGTGGSPSNGLAGAGVAGTGGSGSGGTAGATGGGGAGAGGRSTDGVGGVGGTHSNTSAGSGGAAAVSFVCSQLTGGKLTEEWFIAGFETVVDNSRWQVKWREDAYVEVWADAQSSFWTAQVDSTCANHSSAPDRLVFGAVSFKYKTQAEWRIGITQAVNNFKAKWPSVRRVDLVTQIRGPNNMLCPTAPTANETIAVPPEQDAGMADVAAAFPGFVFVGPKVLAHSCSEFQGGGPHLTAAGNQANVSVLSAYFAQE